MYHLDKLVSMSNAKISVKDCLNALSSCCDVGSNFFSLKNASLSGSAGSPERSKLGHNQPEHLL